ncbi:MAG: ABC transporter ATP-binding protein [Bacteroidia bacterium]
MKVILEVKGLKKAYGRLIAANDISFEVKQGQVFGLLGPNGSGKTTLLGCISGILTPNGGSFEWFNGVKFDEARKRIGALIETPNFFPYLSAFENLKIVAAVKACPEERIDVVLKEVDLLDRKNDAFKKFSLGMKQRLAIASALLSDPEVLILDEPTNGLDPQGINEIRSLIMRQQQSGKTVILASHLLNEVEKVCSDVVILRKGKVISHGRVDDLLKGKLRVVLGANNLANLKAALSNSKLVESFNLRDSLIYADLVEGSSIAELNKCLVDAGVEVNHLNQLKSDLESEFLKLIQQ